MLQDDCEIVSHRKPQQQSPDHSRKCRRKYTLKKHAARLHHDRLPVDESTYTVAVKRQVHASIYIYIYIYYI